MNKLDSSTGGKLRILYIQQNTTSFAGVEHVIDLVASEISKKYRHTFDIDVLYTSVHANRPVEKRNYREIENLADGRLSLMRICRDAVKRGNYDVVIVPQIEPAVMSMLACIGLKQKFVVYLHGNPRRERSHIKAKIMFFLMKAFFVKRLAFVFGTSPKQLEAFNVMFDSRAPQAWLPNPVRRFELAKDEAGDRSELISFVNVGRFAYQKGQDILIDAFAQLARMNGSVRLRIVGYGSGEEQLREQIKALKLEALVSIEHLPDNPAPALATSDIYVSTSRWEGWSLAICEALRFGVPVVSTDCEFGPSDILTDPRLGVLVKPDSISDLVAAMAYYANNLAEEARHSEFRMHYIDRFDVNQIVDVHAQAVAAAANVGRGTERAAQPVVSL